MDLERIRNFSIIAHIDHGKSTLADRILELTKTVSGREMRAQVLDTMELERERGITIKAQAVRVNWKDNELNLIDTPGHVDFPYEDSRSLQACEGADLVVDAAQGVEAQTVANAYLAIENNLEIVPVVNKIDLPQADPDGAAAELAELVGGKPADVLRISAKTGEGVAEVLDAIVERIPMPSGLVSPKAPPRALVFDSSYDQYRGGVAFVGFGFRCGFLGLLHMEIVRERLEREFDLDLLVTAPNVAYRVLERNGDWLEVHNPAEMPRELDAVEEPYIRASIIVPKSYVGPVMELNNERRGRFDHMEYLSPERVLLAYELPLAEIVLDYYDQLNSRTRRYASFHYDVAGFRDGQLARVDILIADEPVDALSMIVHREAAYSRGKALVERLRQEIPRQFFDVAVQAAIGSRVIARETVKAKRKDVLAKCYGGDITRKRKLLEKQKAGKRRMKQVGAVEVPQEAFLAVLNLNDGTKR